MKKINNKGITLVALVVTIVVLLILAGISLNLILGNNGIIRKSEKAKENYSIASEEEEQKLQQGSDWIDKKTGDMVDIDSLPTTDVNTTVTEKYAKYTDSDTNTAIIPNGFKVVTGLDKVKEGLVIEDVSAGDSVTKGSQFVWIPVNNYDNFHLIEGYDGRTLTSFLSSGDNPSREPGSILGTPGVPGKPNAKNSTKGNQDSVAMYKSVHDFKGFYIARYEAGINGTTESTESYDDNKKTIDGTVKPVSKQNVGVWNFIPWGGNTTGTVNEGEETDENGAVKVSKNMYTKNVHSTLCYGVQWDATMQFIDNKYVLGTSDDTSFAKISENKGNYSGSIAKTGSNTAYAQKNIYDLAGNCWEWTKEIFDSDLRMYRGGPYSGNGLGTPASDRTPMGREAMYPFLGFRVALYL